LLYFFFAGPLFAFTLAPEIVSIDTVWQKDAGPYVLSSNLTIENGASLTIEPGVAIAVSGNRAIFINGSLFIGTESSEKTIFDSTINLIEQYPEFWDFADDGNINLIVSGGRVSLINIEFLIPTYVQSRGGVINISNIQIPKGAFLLSEKSQTFISSSTLESMKNFMIGNGSELFINNSKITGSLSDSLFYVSSGSKLFFENSEIIPTFSNFVLLLDGSKLSATSTKISNMHSYGIQAQRNNQVFLYDVHMSDIFSPVRDSAFLMLVGSNAVINNSTFSNTASNVIELYTNGSVPSNFLMKNSVIRDFGRTGISAVRAIVSIQNSDIIRGGIGIENIFSSTTISYSNISQNSDFGILAYVTASSVSAENNFWGDASGPYNEATNISGTGNAVSSNVSFDPWLPTDLKNVCCSSVLFLPGLQASRLYRINGGKEKRLWEPTIGGLGVPELFMNSLGESIRSDIYTRDIIDEAVAPLIGPNIYKSFIKTMDSLRDSGVISDWKPVPYDWRFSLDDTLMKVDIVGEIERLAHDSKTGKVTLVAHSNGGLLAKALMIKLSSLVLDNLIDRLIFVAVPQTGTPQAIGALLHGYDQGIRFFLSIKTAVELGINMPSAYNLLPSESYFKSVIDPVIKIRESSESIASSTVLYNFLSKKGLNKLLINQAKITHENTDAWQPPLTVDLVQIAGWGLDTVSGIEYFQGKKYGKPVILYKPIIVIDGDNTVVVPSALALATSTQNIDRYWLNLKKYNSQAINRKHSDILEVDEVGEFITRLIKKEDALPEYFSTSTPLSEKNNKRLHFVLYSPTAEIHMYDDSGNHVGVSTTSPYIDEQIPDTYYREFGEVKYISTATSRGGYVLIKDMVDNSLNERGSFTLEVDEVYDNFVATSTVFIDIPTQNQNIFILNIPESISSITPMEVDENNDGAIDFYIAPGEIPIPEIITQSNKFMETTKETQMGHRRRTTIYEIQELIDDIKIKLPEFTNIGPTTTSTPITSTRSTTTSTSTGFTTPMLVITENNKLEMASVFYAGQTLDEFIRAIIAIIITILKKLHFWFFEILKSL